MVTGTHPEDIDLFDYVEDDLSQRRRAELEVHLASCARCAEQVARVRDGRDALREAQFLELSKRRRDGIFLDLPSQPREPRRRSRFSLKRVAAVAAPVTAVALIALAVSLEGGTEQNEFGAAAGQATQPSSTAAAEAAEGGGQDAPQDTAAERALLFAQGPADNLAAELRGQGFDAEVVDGHVEVRGATRAEVRRALDNRQALNKQRDGGVRIVIVP